MHDLKRLLPRPEFKNQVTASHFIATLRSRPHVSGHFRIHELLLRIYFVRPRVVYFEPNLSVQPTRIHSSIQGSSVCNYCQQSMRVWRQIHLFGIYSIFILLRHRIKKCPDSTVHTYPDSQHISGERI